ncbi:MAG: ACP phosphodiesterase [Gammaproteobacteria bacterium]|nr:ACP phosphodiesterase [Gammaproteobacteria bacterium]MDH3858245.1 ACP phosphodiesterase [Gammaproteobacteria bacterium]
MNHFAHLVLAQPTVESTIGNLLGDFARGIDPELLPGAVRAGLNNHRAVDRFTDTHPLIREMKQGFSPDRRRFAGIALDIYFDHLLIIHWKKFEARNLEDLIASFYRHMSNGQALMPAENMRRVTLRMIDYDWFGSYRDLDAVAEALDRVAGRIRFANQFDNAIEDLQRNHESIRDGFFEFYPQLQQYVENQAIETR